VTGSTNDLDPRAHAPIRAPARAQTARSAPRPTPGRSPTVRRSNPPSPIRCRIWRWPGACYLWLWPVLAGVRYLVTIQFVCPRRRVDRATCTLSDCRFSSQSGVVGPRSGRELDLVVRIGRVCRGERVGQRRRWEAELGLPLRECSCLRHDQVLKWTGMRPLIRIDRTELYHGGCSLSRSYRGVAPALAALRPWSVWPTC